MQSTGTCYTGVVHPFTGKAFGVNHNHKPSTTWLPPLLHESWILPIIVRLALVLGTFVSLHAGLLGLGFSAKNLVFFWR